MFHAIDRLALTQSVQVIGIGNAGVRAGGGGEAPAVRPGEVPPGAVIIADGVAALDGTRDGFGGGVIGLALVGDQLAFEGGQQVSPPDVGVGVGMTFYPPVCCLPKSLNIGFIIRELPNHIQLTVKKCDQFVTGLR